MHGDGIVDRRGHALVLQMRGQAVAVLVLDRVLGPDRNPAVDHGGHAGDMGCQTFGIAVRRAVAPLDLLREDLQLLDQDGGLDGVQTAVHADPHGQVFGVVGERLAGLHVLGDDLAVDPQRVHFLGEILIIGQHRPAVAVAAQRLGREEAGGGDVGPFDGMVAIEGTAEALGRIGDQLEAVAVTDGPDGRIVGGLAEQVDGDDHARLQSALLQGRLDRRLELDRVHVEGPGVHIHKHRRGTQPRHDLGRRRKGETGTEDRIAGADAPSDQGQDQGVGAVGAAERVLRLAEGGQISLELAHLRSHDPGTAHDGFLHGGLDPAVETKALGLKVDEGDAHVGNISGRAA